jgi:GTP-binding protein HflX
MLRAVDEVLEEIGAGDRPRILVLNKADLLDEDGRHELWLAHPDAVLVSAATGEGLDVLGERVEAWFRDALRAVELLVPYREGALLAELHELAGDTLEREDTPEGVRVRALVPAVVAERVAPYVTTPGEVIAAPVPAAEAEPEPEAAAARGPHAA